MLCVTPRSLLGRAVAAPIGRYGEIGPVR